MPPLRACEGLLACLIVLLAAPLGAQEEQEEPDLPARDPGAAVDDPPHAIEFALGSDDLGFAYRSGLHRGRGYTTVGFFVGDDDDVALHARLMRFSEPRAELPLGIGVGLGAFAAEIDSSEEDAFAITLTGAADYALDQAFGWAYPTRVGVELSWAPDVATFADGERVLDLLGRVEVDLSTWATAFVGYRRLEVDVEDAGGVDLDDSLHLGVRLGF